MIKGIIEYLILGLMFDVVFDLITKRLRSKFHSRVLRLQYQTGYGYKTCVVLIVFGLIAFWPAVLIGMVTNNGDSKDADNHY